MPVKRRHAKQRRAEVSSQVREYLEDQLDYIFFAENTEITAGWQQLEAEIVEQWILTRPGTRPRMWWRISAPEPGRLSNGGPPGGAPNRLVIPCTLPSPADQEAFLRRHDLLLPGELERLTAD